ncbi:MULTISPECIES: hypothetical protein [Shewanella]|uniref:hypothetical protein n=1 Tax=Shewanella TaxID=22 RepID=UPI0002F5050D|nr:MULTISPECIES: hypothetical protein [Shewanella]MDI5838010.1 hypothetical protein [Shewanella xiamenensis]MDI5841872.1 hypothetical protein [Shewanella xiamenensis]MDI5845805.1 hypothetical protein [Shewanella xiamenensis]MDI5849484.1 hypothetical protein [Shewanella xiamenensis]MDI5853681.1 hypothetical protein [Shewanella xiamenensis]
MFKSVAPWAVALKNVAQKGKAENGKASSFVALQCASNLMLSSGAIFDRTGKIHPLVLNE